MSINRTKVRSALREFDFEALFIEELGWDRPPRDVLRAVVDGVEYPLRPIAHKRGLVAFICEIGGRFPSHAIRRKIDREATKSAHEHIVIFVDSGHSSQVWQWIRREPGKPAALRQHVFYKDQSGDSLIQRLEALAFSLEEEESLTITGVAGRARQAFDVDRVTKRFYERFESVHKSFLGFIKGIQSQGDREWYASLMLNRLMFTYFIQKKGFLDGDLDYLRNRLGSMRTVQGDDRFHSFYRYFLLRLFHEGLGQENRLPDLDHLLGRIPYLNGGLFDVHVLERSNSDIEISDEAFERVFDFFDSYQWHLDERPLRADNEINPDVLGYIFEKYINQKQMGAYYTKEDITGYMSRNSVVPSLLDTVQESCATSFDSATGSVWQLLRADPDRYIDSSLRHGFDQSLPKEIAEGIESSSLSRPVVNGVVQTIELRRGWSKQAPDEYALPTETWREVVARRNRYAKLREKVSAGEVCEVADLVTLNLDALQLSLDVVESCDNPALLQGFWHAIMSITVLDPACGSGAFLFAALNILEPLYEACLDRMQSFSIEEPSSELTEMDEFRAVLARVSAHPNRRYFIFKSIILNNLFGVDIMDEAVEICKLRLFLKLAAQVEPDSVKPNFGIEPLPDIDFNIRTGNTLVGFATYEEAERSITSKFDFESAMAKISTNAIELQAAFDEFREQQVDGDGAMASNHKPELRSRLEQLQSELNRYLAQEFGIDAENRSRYESWLISHQPFHWFVEFYGIMSQGGFDVVIGNPPYVEIAKIKSYSIPAQLLTKSCGNLYAPMVERFTLLGKPSFRLGVIVPMSLSCTARMAELRGHLQKRLGETWISHFSGDANPSKLFEGVKLRLDILLAKGGATFSLRSSKYLKWFAAERPNLFSQIEYASTPESLWHLGLFPKTGSEIAVAVLEKVMRRRRMSMFARSGKQTIYVHRVMTMFIKCFDFIPYFRSDTDGVKKSEDYKPYQFGSKEYADVAAAAISSTTFFLYFVMLGDCFHCGKEYVLNFPFDLEAAEDTLGADLVTAERRLMKSLQDNAVRRKAVSARTGALEYDEFWPSRSKPVIDEIDQLLARHYEFTELELDFIINYDLKYRMGADGVETPEIFE